MGLFLSQEFIKFLDPDSLFLCAVRTRPAEMGWLHSATLWRELLTTVDTGYQLRSVLAGFKASANGMSGFSQSYNVHRRVHCRRKLLLKTFDDVLLI